MPGISAKQRKEVGKHLTTLRKEGFLPAVLYGPGVPATSLSVPVREFEKALAEAGETSLLTLAVEGDKAYDVLIHDVAKDPMTLKPIHADFYAVRMDKPIEAKIPLVFVGESPAVKNESGILVKVLHELDVKALPKDLPHEITVDVTRLEHINEKLHVKDISLPAGVAVLAGPEEAVVIVEPPRSEAELEELVKAEEAAPAPAEVKTEREAKAETQAETGEVGAGTEEAAGEK